MGRRTTVLSVVDQPDPRASILAPGETTPVKGDEPHDLRCGSCHSVIANGVSAERLDKAFIAPIQLLIKCPVCGKHNRVAGKSG